MLLKQSSSKNFYILGCLIDCNDSLRQNIQMSVIENLEELKNTPDFIYLASKCILNSALDESSDTKFLETVSLSYWEAVSNYLMMDIGSPDTLLENSAAGKAVQILFHQKILGKIFVVALNLCAWVFKTEGPRCNDVSFYEHYIEFVSKLEGLRFNAFSYEHYI